MSCKALLVTLLKQHCSSMQLCKSLDSQCNLLQRPKEKSSADEQRYGKEFRERERRETERGRKCKKTESGEMNIRNDVDAYNLKFLCFCISVAVRLCKNAIVLLTERQIFITWKAYFITCRDTKINMWLSYWWKFETKWAVDILYFTTLTRSMDKKNCIVNVYR